MPELRHVPLRPVSLIERVAPWFAGALIALPVLVFHYPPMADVPLHEAVVGLLRHWGDPAYVPPGVYDLNLGLGNQLFYFVILALAYVVPIGVATKLVVAGTLLLLPVAAARFAEHLGVTRWSAVLVAPLGLGWMFFFGLLANLMGVAVYLAMLPSLDLFCERPTRRRFASVCAWIVLLHFTHDLMTLIAAGTLLLLTACSVRGWRENVVRALPVALAVALVLSTRAVATKLLSVQHARLTEYGWASLGHKLAIVPGALYAGYEWWVRDLLFLVCAVPAALFGVERWRAHTPRARTWREWAHDFRFEILGASLLLSYAVAPADVKETTIIYQRFLTPAWIVLTVTACTRARLEAPWRLPRLLTAMVPLAPLLTSLPPFAENDRIFTQLDAAITHMEPGSTYIVLELGPASDYGLVHPLGGVGHIVGVLGGKGLYDFTFSETAPVYQRREKQWTALVDRMTGSSYALLPSYDLTRFRYALLHTPDESIADVAVLALAPDARPIAREGEWTVMESTLALVPIDSPDEPTPAPPPKTLRERCLEVVARIRATSM